MDNSRNTKGLPDWKYSNILRGEPEIIKRNFR